MASRHRRSESDKGAVAKRRLSDTRGGTSDGVKRQGDVAAPRYVDEIGVALLNGGASDADVALNGNAFTCEICGQHGLDEVTMRHHLRAAHVDHSDIRCPFCEYSGVSPDRMSRHVNQRHLDSLSPSKESGEPIDRQPSSPLQRPGQRSDRLQRLAPPRLLPPPSFAKYPPSRGSPPVGVLNSFSYCTDDYDFEQEARNVGVSGAGHRRPTSENPRDGEALRRTSVVLSDGDARLPAVVLCAAPDSPRRCCSTGPCNVDCSEGDEITVPRTKRVLDGEFAFTNLNGNNNNDGSVGSTNGGAALEDNAPGGDVECPICGVLGLTNSELSLHVNVEHLDVISPVSPIPISGSPMRPDDADQPGSFTCPICERDFSEANDVERHVNFDHQDILSPSSPGLLQASFPMGACAATMTPNAPSTTATSTETCPVCDAASFSDSDAFLRHVDSHFQATPTAGSGFNFDVETGSCELILPESQGGGSGAVRSSLLAPSELDLDGGLSATPDLLPSVRSYLTSAPAAGSVGAFWLCLRCTHFATSPADAGWGCGYRNLQMMLSSMIADDALRAAFEGSVGGSFVDATPRPLADTVTVPSIRRVQTLIEHAWSQGFDPPGAGQLGRSLVGTKKWIGATEIVAVLTSLKVSTTLIDFHAPTGHDGSHPRLFEWVKTYFEREPHTTRHPLYLQHQGHSRTIVGVEERRDGGLRLLLFDPSVSPAQMRNLLPGRQVAQKMAVLRRTPAALRHRQYQIVAVNGVLTEEQRLNSKVIRSSRIP